MVHLVQKTRAKNSHAWAPLNLKYFVFQRCICGVRRAGQCVLHLLAEDEGGKCQGIQGTARPHRVRLEPKENTSQRTSVADPNPDPDPPVFGPPGSGSISQRYGSGVGACYHQAKILRKTLISGFLLFCDFFLTFYLWKKI
jgi:hypothetical protein